MPPSLIRVVLMSGIDPFRGRSSLGAVAFEEFPHHAFGVEHQSAFEATSASGHASKAEMGGYAETRGWKNTNSCGGLALSSR